MRGGVPRVELERTAQVALGVTGLPGCILREREVDECVAAARVEGQRLPGLSGGGIESPQPEERGGEIHVRGHVAGFDGNDPLELARRLVEKPFAQVQITEIVVRLQVQLVPLECGLVVHERLLEVTRALVVQRELKIVTIRDPRRFAPRLNGPRGLRDRRRDVYGRRRHLRFGGGCGWRSHGVADRLRCRSRGRWPGCGGGRGLRDRRGDGPTRPEVPRRHEREDDNGNDRDGRGGTIAGFRPVAKRREHRVCLTRPDGLRCARGHASAAQRVVDATHWRWTTSCTRSAAYSQ